MSSIRGCVKRVGSLAGMRLRLNNNSVANTLFALVIVESFIIAEQRKRQPDKQTDRALDRWIETWEWLALKRSGNVPRPQYANCRTQPYKCKNGSNITANWLRHYHIKFLIHFFA